MLPALAFAFYALTLFPLCSSTPTTSPLSRAPSTGNSTTPAPVADTPSLVSRASAISPGFPYGSQKIRGVNLGGWLVLEVSPALTIISRLLHNVSGSLGSPRAYLTTLAIIVLWMSSHMGSLWIATPRLPRCRIIGTRGSLNQVRIPLPAPRIFRADFA